MIVQLSLTNLLAEQIELRTNIASNQPVMPKQQLQLTLELHEGPNGVAELQLAIAPAE